MSTGIRRRNAENWKKALEGEEEARQILDKSINCDDDGTLLHTSHWFGIFTFYMILICSSLHFHQCLPKPLDPSPENTIFSENRAVQILHELSDIGWKPAGSYNCEELTKSRIIDEIREIKEFASKNVTFEIDLQFVSGCFGIPAHDTEGMNICYRNVSNVVAKLGASRSTSSDDIAILLNCHFDSWPTSNGGSDDLISCALMLELMRIYSHNPQFLKHNIVFLFNGAEESSLLAAHGFITQHPWRHQIRAFINLEASGSGGRELLFQAGPANQWLLNSYLEAAIHPHCSVIGQEVFQSGVYPGDTDFRVFRDHGRVPGLDLAFVQNGYWWHTEFDVSHRITNGSLQRAGENVLATLNHLLESPYLEHPATYSDRKTVFFDFLGLFVVIYPLSIAHVVNISLILLVAFQTIKYFQTSKWALILAIRDYLIIVFSMFITIEALIFMSNFTYGSMRWYSRQWLAIVAYGLPCFWCGFVTSNLLVARVAKKTRKIYGECLELVHLILISLILLIFTYQNIASGFLFSLLLIPIFKIIATQFIPVSPTFQTIVTLIGSLPGCSMCIYTSEMLLSIFIPIMGRTSTNPEPIVAMFVAFSSFSLLLSLIGLIARTKNELTIQEATIRDFIYRVLGVLMISLTILYIFASFWPSPYRYDEMYPTAKRTQFFHVNQKFYDRNDEISVEETRFYAISHDYRGADDIPFVKADDNYTMLQCHYPQNPYCEIPFYFPTRQRIADRHIRVRRVDEILTFPHRVKIMAVSKKRNVVDDENHNSADGKPRRLATIDYRFSVIGTGQMSVYVIADEDWRVVSTSVSIPDQPQAYMFLYFTCSSPNNICEWFFDIRIQQINQQISEDKPLLVGVSSHYLHGKHMQSESIKNMIRKIEENRIKNPEWMITASAWNVDQIYKYF